ncbi:lysin A [Mycobacterium phage BiancaTri92]|nr:lysin A [Mycobacterium phage BiancaTri92]
MARRLFNGRAFSEDGWPYVDEGSCTWTLIPGSNDVWLQIQNGPPLAILRAFAADYNAYVEPLRDPDSACWTPGNSVATSNHPGGTSMDLNWNTHPFQVRGTFNAAQMRTIRELLDFYEGTVFWAGDWNSPVDEMHWQMGYDTYNQAQDRPHQFVLDFVNRKIRPDGFSTFRRGNAPSVNKADILARATGLSVTRASEILPTMVDGLKQADCTNWLRIAMFIAQTGHESAGFATTEEYASGDAYDTRTDLGNTPEVDGDGRLYKGRTWIQITGKTNYRKFSEWAYSRGLVPNPVYFVERPLELADLKWAGIGAAWYWTVARSDINALSDARDLDTVTRRINGGTNGIDDRRARYNRALAVGEQLMALISQEDDDELADPVIQKMIRELHGAMFNSIVSQSPYRDPKLPDGSEPRGNVWQLHELIKNGDGMVHMQYVENAARGGDLTELNRIVRAARGQGADTSPWIVQRAQRFIADLEATKPEVLKQYIAAGGSL